MGFFDVDRSIAQQQIAGGYLDAGPVDIIAAIEAGALAIRDWVPPPPCGTKINPHIVHPEVAAGRSHGLCVNCGEYI